MPKRVKVIGNLFNGTVPDGAVYIGRAFVGLKQSPFANPWCVKSPGSVPWRRGEFTNEWVVSHHRDRDRIAGGFATREAAQRAAVLMYRKHLDENPQLRERAIAELRGKDLACWCKPHEACHGDYLVELVNGAVD